MSGEPDMMPIAATVDALERRLAAAETRLARLLPYGNQLANCAFNLKQSDRLTDNERKCLEAAQRGWDQAKEP